MKIFLFSVELELPEIFRTWCEIALTIHPFQKRVILYTKQQFCIAVIDFQAAILTCEMW